MLIHVSNLVNVSDNKGGMHIRCKIDKVNVYSDGETQLAVELLGCLCHITDRSESRIEYNQLISILTWVDLGPKCTHATGACS